MGEPNSSQSGTQPLSTQQFNFASSLSVTPPTIYSSTTPNSGQMGGNQNVPNDSAQSYDSANSRNSQKPDNCNYSLTNDGKGPFYCKP